MVFRFFILLVCVAFISAGEIPDDDDDDESEGRSQTTTNYSTIDISFDNSPMVKPINVKHFDKPDSSFSEKSKDYFNEQFIASSLSSSTYDPFYKVIIASSSSAIYETSKSSSSSSTYMFGKPLQISTSSSNTNYLFDNISPTSSNFYSFGSTNKPTEIHPFNKNKIHPFGENNQDDYIFPSSHTMSSSISIYSVTPTLKMASASINAHGFQTIYSKASGSSEINSSNSSLSFGHDLTNIPLIIPIGASSIISQTVAYPNMFNAFDNSSSSKSSISPTTSSNIFSYKTDSFRR